MMQNSPLVSILPSVKKSRIFLASDFIRQYLGACEILDDKEIQDLFDVRYGRQEGSALKDAKAFHFLKLERKLFLQYPTNDDD